MALIVLCSAKGSPGVTTTALALGWVWPTALPGRRSLVVDADPAGSGVLPGFFQANAPQVGGILGLVRSGDGVEVDDLLTNAVALESSGERLVLPGIVDPAQARALAGVWSQLAHVAHDADVQGLDILVDVGRLGHLHQPSILLDRADLVVVVLRASLVSIAAARPAVGHLQELRGAGGAVVGALVGDQAPYTAKEIASELGVEIPIVVPRDAVAARMFSDGIGNWSRMARSPLLRSATAAAGQLVLRVPALAPTEGWGA
ncbi:hypothetical protein [Pengzhenrongella sp.]|jgi:Mrp family chromosome partitioning ATPase|uniref:hypothetical protein n=1 Tax=Pengzhenrongella sp. TaxID=2888820 RepID=UPI002F956F7F